MRSTLLTLVALLCCSSALWAADGNYPGHGISMYGDLKYGPDFKHFDYVNPQAPKGGELKQAVTGTFDSFNAFIIKGNPAAGVPLIFDTLLTPSADEPFSEYGLLAEKVEVPADRSWVSFTLRAGARWHDGKPVTVEDVIWSLETLRTKGHPQFRGYYESVARAEKTGERTVKFTFKPGQNRELPLIIGQFPVFPKHDWGKRNFEETTLEPLLGSGPYRIGKFQAGRFVSYERVADYWGKDLPVNVGRYNFDVMRFEYYRDDTVELEGLKAGEYDFRAENSSKEWATAYDVPAIRSGQMKKESLPHQKSAGMQGFAFNTRRPLFQDRRVREAIGYAFDFEWSNKNLFYGQYKRTRSYFQNSELAAQGLPRADELALLEPHRAALPAEVFTTEYQPPKTDGSGNNRDNLQKAVGLLTAAGWKVDAKSRKLKNAEGRELDFEILLLGPVYERIALPFAKNLERLGITARVRSVDPAQYRRRVDDFDFDVLIQVWPQSLSPGNEQRAYWTSAYADTKGSQNVAGIKDPVVDALVEKVIAAPDRKSLVAACRALDRVLQWGFYVVPNWHLDYDRLVFWDKFGRPQTTPMMGYQLDAWWYDAARAGALGSKK